MKSFLQVVQSDSHIHAWLSYKYSIVALLIDNANR